MSQIVAQILSLALRRQDDRELDDAEPIGLPETFTRIRPSFVASYISSLGPSQLWWTRGMILGQNPEDAPVMPPPLFNDRVNVTGNSGHPFRIRGVTKNSGGTPVSNVNCHLFRTSDRAYLESSVSKAGGEYDLGTDNTTTQHFVVAYRPGPDIEGTTVNTLVGS